MPVAAGLRTALDRGIGRNGVGTRIAFACVLEGDGHLRLRGANSDEGDAVGRPVIDGSKIGMQGLGGAYGSYVRVRVGIYRQRVDRGVPDTVDGEQRTDDQRC